jgi:hypothetical protein
MRGLIQRIVVLWFAGVSLFVACRDDPVEPVGDTYVLNLSSFQEFELTYMPDIFCLNEGMLRSVRIVKQDPEMYSVQFQIVTGEYCNLSDTLVVETPPVRSLSPSEQDHVLRTFRHIEIRRPNPDPCQGEWGSFIAMLAQWDARWWTEDCTNDHLNDYSSEQLARLADSLFAVSEMHLGNRPLQRPAADVRRTWPESRGGR